MTIYVTQGEAALCNADSADLPAERETGPMDVETLHSAITDSGRRPFDTAAWLARFGAYCTPPPLLTERRPALDTMRVYATRGRYAPSLHGGVRALGLAWYRGVAAPSLVGARVWEWLTERPARFVVAAVTVKLLTYLPPVAWLVDHLIKPGADFALWLFL